jgi:hypothetical protein
MGPDLFRVFFPYAWKPTIDRGWALETSWEKITGARNFLINQLADEARKNAPAFIFNASVIEEGSPFIITNTEFPRSNTRSDLRKVKEFNNVYQHQLRIRVSTAARLSASFPFVAPAARSDAHPLRPDYHLVDGGYYDNFGILSSIDWLDQALTEGAEMPEKLALIQIRWGNVSDEGGSMKGWEYQISAPFQAVLNVRDKEQLREDRVALETYLNRFPKSGIGQFEFVYEAKPPCDRQPNSWKFTTTQAACIGETWHRYEETARAVAEFLQ